jgi:hypothetical protein
MEIAMKPSLTILTVSFRSEAYMEENLALAARLNPGFPFEWIVVNNDPDRPFPAGSAGPGFKVRKGPRPDPSAKKGGASYHHAQGLNQGLAEVSSRFLLVLDPDFFLLRENWMADTLRHMEERKLSFLGCVWNPEDPQKTRYFPSVHCMFVDLSRVDKAELDFTPELDITNRFKRMMNRFHVPDAIKRRALIGASRDTGYKISRAFAGRPGHAHEVFRPICLDEAFVARYQALVKNPFARLLPDRLSLVPMREGYLTGAAGTPAVHPDWQELRWEGFLWKGSLTALHMRNFGRGKTEPGYELARLMAFLVGPGAK